jgi:hypothetical protein
MLDILITKISQKWLAVRLAAVFPKTYAGIKNPINPAVCFGRFYVSDGAS